MMNSCQKCGAQNDDNALFCNKCGATFQQAPTLPQKAKKTYKAIDILLLLFSIVSLLFIGFLGMLLILEKSTVLSGIVLFLLVLAIAFFVIKTSPHSKKPIIISNGKKFGFVLISLFVSLLLTFATITDDTTEPSEQSTITEPTTIPYTLGDYTVSIKEYYTSKGFYDENLLVVVYSFTNNSKNAISFSDAIKDNLFQNGVELNLYIATNIPGQIEITDSWKELKPGASYDVSRAYVLNFETPSTVEIELNSKDGVSKAINHTVEVK